MADNVVIDEMLLTPDLLPIWMKALAGLDVLLVGVMCPLAIAEQREIGRRNPPGLARGHFQTVHGHGVAYDMTIDTSTGTPSDLGKAILLRQSGRPRTLCGRTWRTQRASSITS
jgi:chloramphenicol 3-O phosphotransferase